jgi:alkanesulfonate monooxygenase SsuD/methylene tetrahydromethanopterin reductase-like flavin-dependent oxidoreductase (luciferase family)
MRFAFNFPIFDHLSEPQVLLELAVAAEEAGWDAVFLWDHVNLIVPGVADGGPHADPWITLGLIAASTRRLTIGTCVTPLARRRPVKVAREVLTLQDLSGGRFVLGAGLGDSRSEFDDFGEAAGLATRAAMLEESLVVLRSLWSGKATDHQGTHYRVSSPPFVPTAVEVPIWLAGTWPNRAPFRRAAEHDGVFAVKAGFAEPLAPAEVAEIAAWIRQHRENDRPFNLAVGAMATGDPAADAQHVQALEAAGANWWVDSTSTKHETLHALRGRVRRGPPGAG